MTRHRMGLAVLAWCAVVVLVSSLVWVVIGRAGRGVAPVSADSEMTTHVVRSPAPQHPPADRVPTPPRRSTLPAGSPPGGSPTSTPPTVATVPTSQATSPPPSSSPPSSPATPPTRRGVWNGQGGFLVAECKGAVIRYVAAAPANGYRLQVDHRGPVEVTVKFGTQAEGAEDIEVAGVCVAGAPRFTSKGGKQSVGDN